MDGMCRKTSGFVLLTTSDLVRIKNINVASTFAYENQQLSPSARQVEARAPRPSKLVRIASSTQFCITRSRRTCQPQRRRRAPRSAFRRIEDERVRHCVRVRRAVLGLRGARVRRLRGVTSILRESGGWGLVVSGLVFVSLGSLDVKRLWASSTVGRE